MILNKLFHFLQVDKIVVIAIGIMICVSFTGCIEKEKEINAVISVKESGFIHERIEFDGSKSFTIRGMEIKKWEWEFGDGTNGSGKKTTHEYSEEGNYTIVLTVVDDNNITDETEVEIEIRRGIKYFEVDSCWHIPDFLPNIGGMTIFYESEMILPPICSFCIGIGNELEAGTPEKYSAWDIKSEEGLENYLYLNIEEWGVTIPDPERGYK